MFSLPDVRNIDFEGHNQESAELWEAFNNGAHDRAPVRLNTNPRILMQDPHYNTRGISYETYMKDPEVMAQCVLEWQYWTRFFLPGDHQKGLPDAWTPHIDFENHYDAAWFGCPVQYREGQVPDTEPILTEDRKRMLFDRGIPDPFEGEWPERCLRFIDYYQKKGAAGWTFLDRPVKPPTWAPFNGSDGVFTCAASLRGPTQLCVDLFEDPDYARDLLDYIHTALVERMKAWRERLGIPIKSDGYFAADDSIELISTETYREFVLPLHKRFYDQFGTLKNRGMHLCGDAQRHFVVIRDQLGVTQFDTGFPVDFGALRRHVGPDVLISGGPRVPFFLHDNPRPLIEETERILRSGILEGGRFILQEGNNLAPQARLDLCQAFYETGKRLGRVPRG